MYQLKVTEGARVLLTSSKSLKFYDDTGALDTTAGVSLVQGALRVFKFNHHAYHKLMMASNKSRLFAGATLASNGMAQGTIDTLTELQLASLDCIEVIE